MRLLHVDNLEFTEFGDHKRPHYAIASHRLQEEEVTFQEVQIGDNKHKKGYKKVEAFAKYVQENIYPVKWLWIDTCCINKDSAAELLEAINSMFRWYLNAALCLAYLADVEICEDTDTFASSVWFTRGWTLQELIAPRTVVFLSEKWQVIGHRGAAALPCSLNRLQTGQSLEDVVASRTGIPQAVLGDSRRIQEFSNEDRMK